MSETIRDVLQKNVQVVKDQAAESKESVGLPTEEIVTPSTEVENTQVEVNDETKDETKVETETKPKRNSIDNRINAKHAEMMHYKEGEAKQKEENEALLKRLEALENPKAEPEELNLDSVDDLEGYLKKVPTRDELESIVKDLIGSELNNAKETIEKQTKETNHKTKQAEFADKMVKYYNPDNSKDFLLDEESLEEASLIMKLFESDPNLYLDIAKTRGIKNLINTVTGKFEAETKADKVKSIIDKANAIKTNTDSNNNVEEYSTTVKPKNFKEVLQQAAKKIKKS